MALKPSAYQTYINKQYENAPVVGAYADNLGQQLFKDAGSLNFSQPANLNGTGGGGTADGAVSGGAVPRSRLPATPEFSGVKPDLRVRIKVPSEYQTTITNAGKAQHGIIFPYTPQISLEHKAEYATQTPLHTNYALNFYKNSSVSDISIQGLFTVQNDQDAMALLSTIHLLRALTKGRFGYSDPLAGAPPPICRLYAYGQYMLDNVPVSISSFKQDLPTDVDYYYLKSTAPGNPFGQSMVPIRSTISIVCKPMFSRSEMLNSTVLNWLEGSAKQANKPRQQGLL